MAHSAGAPAPSPSATPADENPLPNRDKDRANLSLRATGQIGSLREAYHAAASLHDLLLVLLRSQEDKRQIDLKGSEV